MNQQTKIGLEDEEDLKKATKRLNLPSISFVDSELDDTSGDGDDKEEIWNMNLTKVEKQMERNID